MAGLSFAAVLLGVVMKRHRQAKGTFVDAAASAAAPLQTLPTSATPRES
jgi:hypothetical protein